MPPAKQFASDNTRLFSFSLEFVKGNDQQITLKDVNASCDK